MQLPASMLPLCIHQPVCLCLDKQHRVSVTSSSSGSDVNKDWTCKDKDQAYKDQDKD